jgi:hypothetical protein
VPEDATGLGSVLLSCSSRCPSQGEGSTALPIKEEVLGYKKRRAHKAPTVR